MHQFPINIGFENKGQNGTTIFNILDNTTELWMTKYIIGEFFSSGGATLYKNPSDQTVILTFVLKISINFTQKKLLFSECLWNITQEMALFYPSALLSVAYAETNI
jgi:hypothetical protein